MSVSAINTSSSIQTAQGRYFDYLNPDGDSIDIHDIAHALSRICRFGGHTRFHYSVAQHSFLTSIIVPPEDALAALLHDAAEAFIGDIPSPLKALLPDYKAIEKRVEAAVLSKFGLPYDLPESVKEADIILLATERRDLLLEQESEWTILHGAKPLPERIKSITCEQAMELFLYRFAYLTDRKQVQAKFADNESGAYGIDRRFG